MRDFQRNVRRTGETGQAVVVIALLMIGLVAMLGLVLDGGNAYAQRRRMQNAADAAALAGAGRMSQSGTSNQQVLASVNEYATRNGASPNPPAYYIRSNGHQMNRVASYPAYDQPPQGAVGVHVTTTLTVQTYFLGALGINTFTAFADAAAMAGPAGSVVGLVPWALNWDAASAPNGARVSLGSSAGSDGTYNYESIDTDREGLGNFRDAMCAGIRQGVAISPRRYHAVLSPKFTPDERDCLQQRLTARPGETWDHFASDSPRVMLLPVLDGTAGEGYVNVKAFRAFFLEAADVRNSLAYGRFVRLIVSHATLDFSAPNTGVWVVKLTR